MGRYKKKAPSLVQSVLRVAEEEGEEYALVSQVYGGSRCGVKLSTGEDCLCVIRNKFRGRGRRDNFIKVGGWVLVGKREWERPKANKPQTVDLLYVYSPNDRTFITSKYPDIASSLTRLDPNYQGREVLASESSSIVFGTTENTDTVSDNESETAVLKEISESTTEVSFSGDVIDVDDI